MPRPHNAEQMLILTRGLEAMRNANPDNILMGAYHCGTAHCIGGWLAVANHTTVCKITALFDWSDYWSSHIADLFYMWNHSLSEFDERPATERKALAILALENFIHFGTPKWSEVLTKEST